MRLILKPFVVTGIAALTLCALTSSVVAYAQERATDVGPQSLVTPLKAGPPETWGTSSTSVLTIPAFAFDAWDGSIQSHTFYNRFSPTGAEVEAPVFLPAGALISSIELQGCDSDADAMVVFVLFRVNSDGSPVVLSPIGSTGTAATPGCGFFPLALATAHTVDNANTYYVAVRGGTTSATSYTAMRVYYKLQVSPAPGTASFADVPTNHPYFQFIEALKASGITAGCGDGSHYCPSDLVTRGQMAVFLARALGLHWPY
jgi:S-layer homology domain